MRAFIAIRLPEAVTKTLSAIQERLKPVNSGIAWAKPQNLHLTVKFLGEISEDQLREIREIAAETSGTIPVFRLKLEKLGSFACPRASRIIWAGSEQAPAALKQLAANLDSRLSKAGIRKKARFPRSCNHRPPKKPRARLRNAENNGQPRSS
jgi:2'-5' RNA ligase